MDDAMTERDIARTLEGDFAPHSSHWGVFGARMRDGRLEVRDFAGDPDPNRLIDNFPDALRHRARITQPMVRRGWLENGPGRTGGAGGTNSSPCRGSG